MSMPVDPMTGAILAAAVGFGIDGAGAGWPDEPLDDTTFGRLVEIAIDHRLLGALAEAAAAGSFRLSARHVAWLAASHTPWMAHALDLERVLLEIADAFGTAGVDFRVLKGVALGRLVYRDPAWRITSDLDLLVPSDRFEVAVTVVKESLGGQQWVPELRPGFDHEFGKEALVRVGRIEVDIHRTFVTGPFGLMIDLEQAFADADSVTIGGHELLTLGTEVQFIHACFNTALGDNPVRLGSVRDLLLCLDRLDVDMERARSLAAGWHASAVLRRAAELAIEVVGPEPAGELVELARRPVPRREQWLLHSYLGNARSYSRPLASLVVIPGIIPRLRYLRATVAPSQEYLLSRGWTKGRHLRRALTGLRGRD